MAVKINSNELLGGNGSTNVIGNAIQTAGAAAGATRAAVKDAAVQQNPVTKPAAQETQTQPTPERMYQSDIDRLSGRTNTQTVTYIAPNGQKATGTVQQPAQPSYWETMQDYYQRMYDEQVAANNQALEDARSRAQEATDAQLEALRQGYQGTNRQLYRDFMENERALPQQMAARGYSGGLSESSRLRLRNAYEEALAENERARMGEESSANQALAQQLYEAQQAANLANNQAAQNRYSYLAALEEARYKQDRADLENRAALLGSIGDFSVYAQLGYTPAEIARLQAAWNAQHATASSGGSRIGSRSGTPTTTKPTTESVTSEMQQAVAGGATYAEIYDDVRSQWEAGQLTTEQARAIMDQASIDLTQRDHPPLGGQGGR